MIHGDKKLFCTVFSNPLRAWTLAILLQEISPQLKEQMEELNCYTMLNLNQDLVNEEKSELNFRFNISDACIIKKVSISYHNKKHKSFFTVTIFTNSIAALRNKATFKINISLSKITKKEIDKVPDKLIHVVFLLLKYKDDLKKLKEELFKLGNIQYETKFFERKWLADMVILYMNDFVDEDTLLYLQRGDLSIGQKNGSVSIADCENRKEMEFYRKQLRIIQYLVKKQGIKN